MDDQRRARRARLVEQQLDAAEAGAAELRRDVLRVEGDAPRTERGGLAAAEVLLLPLPLDGRQVEPAEAQPHT